MSIQWVCDKRNYVLAGFYGQTCDCLTIFNVYLVLMSMWLISTIRNPLFIAVRHVLLRQGVLGVKVKILKPHDETGMNGPKIQYPDIVTILEPKEETPVEKAKTVE